MTDPSVLIRQLQSRLRWGTGDPNGVVDAPRGAQYQQEDTGAVWRKTTPAGTLTGWVTP